MGEEIVFENGRISDFQGHMDGRTYGRTFKTKSTQRSRPKKQATQE